MARRWVVAIPAYGDAGFAERAIASVPEGIPVHVFDGRYAAFEGEGDLTPQLEEACRLYKNAEYHAPPDYYLPFGASYEGPQEDRPGVYEKAAWMYHEVLPQDVWVLKLDADEELLEGPDPDRLNPDKKYLADIDIHGDDRSIYPTRLVVPDRWTAWLDDCFCPRVQVPRDTPLSQLRDEWNEYRGVGWSRAKVARIANYGIDRPEDYRQRRLDHLIRIGREDAVADRGW